VAAGDRTPPTPTLALVDRLTADDLRACAGRISTWRDAGLHTPLLLAVQEFERSLDAFPLEFGAILSSYQVISGSDPFEGLRIDSTHLRRACERQARSHLLHLREDYLETEGRGDLIADLIVESAPALLGIVESLVRLRDVTAGGDRTQVKEILAPPALDHDVFESVVALAKGRRPSADHARHLFPRYLEALERLVRDIDEWSPRG
jgi:hypothetical protein